MDRLALGRGLALAASFAIVSIAAAEPLVDNLSEPYRSETVFGTDEPDNVWAAQSFSTPATAQLNSIEIIAGNILGAPEIFAELRVGADPFGPVLTTLTIPPLSATSLETITLAPADVVSLEPGNAYWIVVGTTAGGSWNWSYAEGSAFTGFGVFGNYSYSYDGATTWSDYGRDNLYHLRINVTRRRCVADFDDGSSTGTPDGGVGIEDLLYYLSVYNDGVIAADVDDGTSTGTPDGGVGIEDLLYYLTRYNAGC